MADTIQPEPEPTDPGRRLPLRGLALGVAAFLLALIAVTGIKGYRDLATVREQKATLEQQVAEAQRRIEALRHRVERMRSDPATLERLAREELGMVRPDDVVIVLPADEYAESAEVAPPLPQPATAP